MNEETNQNEIYCTITDNIISYNYEVNVDE